MTLKAGDWCHIEIPSSNVERAKKFYSDVFGWQFTEPMPGYSLYRTSKEGIGGGVWSPPEGVPRATVNYILVDEIEPAVEKVQACGGGLVKPKMEVPGAGWFALVTDPDGNCFGLWKSAMQEKAKARPKPAAKKRPAKKKRRR